MNEKALEYPIGPTSGVEKGPARIIILINNRWSVFMGVVAHDTARRRVGRGFMDHFQIRPAVRLETEEEETKEKAYDRFTTLRNTFMDTERRQVHGVNIRHRRSLRFRLLSVCFKPLRATVTVRFRQWLHFLSS